MSDTGAKVCGTVESEAWNLNFTTALINVSDDNDAITQGIDYLAAEISDFSFGIPAGSIIDGIKAVAEFASSYYAYAAYIRLSLSYDDGAHYTYTLEKNVLDTNDQFRTYGSAIINWGRTWTVAEFANGSFRVKVEGRNEGENCYCFLDYLTVTVYYHSGPVAAGSFIQFS